MSPSRLPPKQGNELYHLGVSSHRDVLLRSFGTVRSDQLLDYDGNRFHPEGLFSQKIFGCVTSWHCECGRYTPEASTSQDERNQPGLPYRTICENCRVLVMRNSERRNRFGHIELASPIVHPWFWGNSQRPVELLLGLSTRELRRIMDGRLYVYFEKNMWGKELNLAAVIPAHTISPPDTSLPRWEAGFRVLGDLLENIDLIPLSEMLRNKIAGLPSTTHHTPTWKRLTRRLELVINLIDNAIDPFGFLLRYLPVIPAGLRKIRANRHGTIRVDELTRRYQDVLSWNNSIPEQIEDEEVLIPFRRKMTQLVRRVFELLPGGFPYPLANRVEIPPHFNPHSEINTPQVRRLPRQRKFAAIAADAAYRYPGEFKLRTKKEQPPRWKGKRVDYSAISYVVPDASIHTYQCGLPLDPIAWELFGPLVVEKLMRSFSFSQQIAEAFVTCRGEIALNSLWEVMSSWPVVLSFPGAHPSCRVKAFFSRPVADKAIHLHPAMIQQIGLSTTGGTAKVFLPLSRKAGGEAVGMVSSPITGQPAADRSHFFWPTNEALLGCHLTTKMDQGLFDRDTTPSIASKWRAFQSPEEVELAVEFGELSWTTPILFRIAPWRNVIDEEKHEQAGRPQPRQVVSTAGRVLFDDLVRSVIPHAPEVPYFNVSMDRREFGKLRDWFLQNGLRQQLQSLVEQVNAWGAHRLTQSGLSLSSSDLDVPSSKSKRIDEAWKEVEKSRRHYDRGLISPSERYNKVLDIWTNAREQATQDVGTQLIAQSNQNALSVVFSAPVNSDLKPVHILRRLIGLTGTVAKPDGWVYEMPVCSNLAAGLPSWEYFLLLPGQRREALAARRRRADVWKLIRELAPVLRDLHVVSSDCKTAHNLEKRPLVEAFNGSHARDLRDSLPGRTSAETLIDPHSEITIVSENQAISGEQATRVEQCGFASMRVRSPLTCDEIQGVCSTCLGQHPEDQGPSSPGQAIGSKALLALADQILALTPLKRFFISRPSTAPPGEARALRSGLVSLDGLNVGTNSQGERIILSCDGSIEIRDWQSRVLGTVDVPHGAKLHVREGENVHSQTLLASWNPFLPKIYAPSSATVQLVNLLPGDNVELTTHPNGTSLWHVTRDLGPLRPRLLLLDPMGMRIDHHFLLENTWLHVRDGQSVNAGTLLAETNIEPLESPYVQISGLPQIAIPLRAAHTRPHALLAECAGRVEVSTINEQGRCTILVHELNSKGKPTGDTISHAVTPYQRVIVHTGDHVRLGRQLTAGEASLHDVLRICGRNEASSRLLSELIYALAMQRPPLDIDERLWELVISRLFSRAEIVSAGSTKELPGKVVERNRLIRLNEQLRESYLITDAGDTPLEPGSICTEEEFQEACQLVQAQRGNSPQAERPWLVGFHPLLTPLNARQWSDVPPVLINDRYSSKAKLVQAALAGYWELLDSPREAMLTGRLISTGSGWSKRNS